MTRLLYHLIVIICVCQVQAQDGLERVFVEEISLSALAPEARCGVKSGYSVYRIYADLTPGTRLLAVFGSPGHPLSVGTSGEWHDTDGLTLLDTKSGRDRCDIIADSYLTIGASSRSARAVSFPKALLERRDTSPIGFIEMLGWVDSTTVQLSSFGLEGASFSSDRSEIRTENGSWAAFGGVAGPTDDNRVLIAQLVANGPLYYELNFQMMDSRGAYLLHARPEEGQLTNVSLKSTLDDH